MVESRTGTTIVVIVEHYRFRVTEHQPGMHIDRISGLRGTATKRDVFPEFVAVFEVFVVEPPAVRAHIGGDLLKHFPVDHQACRPGRPDFHQLVFGIAVRLDVPVGAVGGVEPDVRDDQVRAVDFRC